MKRNSPLAKIIIAGAVLIGLIALLSTAGQNQSSVIDNPQNSFSEQIHTETTGTEPIADIRTEKLHYTESIPFETETINDSSMDIGSDRVKVQGKNGVLTRTYEVIYIGDSEVSRKEIGSVITTQPINQVNVKGTKPIRVELSCKNGTYINSSGNRVCRPHSSKGSVPYGASAQCRDGTYSFSQSRRGTCSHHGGVARWL